MYLNEEIVFDDETNILVLEIKRKTLIIQR